MALSTQKRWQPAASARVFNHAWPDFNCAGIYAGHIFMDGQLPHYLVAGYLGHRREYGSAGVNRPLAQIRVTRIRIVNSLWPQCSRADTIFSWRMGLFPLDYIA